MKKISVIIPVYNMQKYIKQCLNSILSQSLEEVEIICIDDGSTDNSYNILREYSTEHNNIIALHQNNQGSGLARNKGIGCAKGKYICFMDPDDYYAHDQVLEQLYTNAEKNKVSICGGNLVSISENGEINESKRWFYENKMILFEEFGNYYYYTSFIFERKFIQENRILFPSYRRYQDPPFLLKAMVNAKNFYSINSVVYIYRIGHKKEKFPLNITIDVLKGIRDCFKIAQENDLTIVYEKELKHKLNDYFKIIYPYAYKGQKEIWKLLDDINTISKIWKGEKFEKFADVNTLRTYIKNLRDKWDYMMTECRSDQEIVIYGAGKVGCYFLENYEDKCKHIIGFAVSRKDEEGYIKGYKVKLIDDYSRDAFIIVAVSERYSEEILHNLKIKQFKKICYVEDLALRIFHEDAESIT